MNPHAEVSINYVDKNGNYRCTNSAGTASGCGYDKESASVASALNDTIARYFLAEKKIKHMKTHNHDLLGYGSGYNLIPAFEGGVGMRSLIGIFKNLGCDVANENHGKGFDTYFIVNTKKSRAKKA